MDKINNLITHLLALEGIAKNIHYHIADYGVHLFSDRVQENLSGFIDELKENCLLAKNKSVLNSSIYFLEASKLISDIKTLDYLKVILIDSLVILEQIVETSKGDEDLLGRIGSDLQNSLGVLNILLGDKK